MPRSVLSTLILLIGMTPLIGTASPARTLTFEDRVRAQEAIERVYYCNRSAMPVRGQNAPGRALRGPDELLEDLVAAGGHLGFEALLPSMRRQVLHIDAGL